MGAISTWLLNHCKLLLWYHVITPLPEVNQYCVKFLLRSETLKDRTQDGTRRPQQRGIWWGRDAAELHQPAVQVRTRCVLHCTTAGTRKTAEEKHQGKKSSRSNLLPSKVVSNRGRHSSRPGECRWIWWGCPSNKGHKLYPASCTGSGRLSEAVKIDCKYSELEAKWGLK